MIPILALALIAADQPPPAPDAEVSADQRKQLQADLHALAVGLGAEAAPAEGKTLAEVSDKALSMLEKSVSTVAAGVEKAAPQVWRVALRQQYARAIAPLIVPFGACCLLFPLALFAWRKGWAWSLTDGAWETPGPFLLWVGVAAAVLVPGFFLLRQLQESTLLLINPEWYALRDLVQLLLGKSVVGP